MGTLGRQPDALTAVRRRRLRLGASGDLQPLASPDPLDPLVVRSAGPPEQRLGDPCGNRAARLPGELHDIVPEPS